MYLVFIVWLTLSALLSLLWEALKVKGGSILVSKSRSRDVRVNQLHLWLQSFLVFPLHETNSNWRIYLHHLILHVVKEIEEIPPQVIRRSFVIKERVGKHWERNVWRSQDLDTALIKAWWSTYWASDASMNMTKKGLFSTHLFKSNEFILKLHFLPWLNFSNPFDATVPRSLYLVNLPSMIRVGKSRNLMAIAGLAMWKKSLVSAHSWTKNWNLNR